MWSPSATLLLKANSKDTTPKAFSSSFLVYGQIKDSRLSNTVVGLTTVTVFALILRVIRELRDRLMGMLSSIQSMMTDEGFTPSASTFPEIDTNSIERSLKIRSKAKERGAENKPSAEQEASDAVELEIVERMRFLRNQGTEFYENMLSAYKARINRAESISQEIKTGALSARGDFLSSATNNRAEMAYSLMGVVDALKYLKSFREEHKINRPYLEETRKSVYTLAIVVVVMLIIEVAINASFFAETSPQGLLGGAFFALIFALVNVAISGFVGWFSRFKNHRSFFLKLLGFSVILIFLCSTIILNMGIGLYRDALEATGEANRASELWISRIENQEFMLQSIKSVILAIMGVMISLYTVTKTYGSFDPYPGYGAVARRVENALQAYAGELYETIADLEEKRDLFIDEFKVSCHASDTFLSEAADALSGQATLTNKLNAFYEEVTGKTAMLVQIYRDTNVEARADGKIPKCFQIKLGIEKQTIQKMDTSKLERMADERRNEIKTISDRAINDISRIYEAYVSYFPSVEALRSDWKEADLPNWGKTVEGFGVHG